MTKTVKDTLKQQISLLDLHNRILYLLSITSVTHAKLHVMPP